VTAHYISGDETYRPDTLRIGVLPDDSEEALHQRHSALANYLSEELAIPVELVIPDSYNQLVSQFGQGYYDLAYFGGLTFVQAESRYEAEALVMRDIDARFSSTFFTRPEHSGSSLQDFKGQSLVFGSRLSTSGHLMPRHFIKQRLQNSPENHFGELIFSGSHDNTINKVSSGFGELGVANTEIINTMLRDGRLAEGDIKIIWQTPPYTDYVWATSAKLAEPIKNRLRDAFLTLDGDNQQQHLVLNKSGANAFLPANKRDFHQLGSIARELKMLGERSPNK